MVPLVSGSGAVCGHEVFTCMHRACGTWYQSHTGPWHADAGSYVSDWLPLLVTLPVCDADTQGTLWLLQTLQAVVWVHDARICVVRPLHPMSETVVIFQSLQCGPFFFVSYAVPSAVQGGICGDMPGTGVAAVALLCLRL